MRISMFQLITTAILFMPADYSGFQTLKRRFPLLVLWSRYRSLDFFLSLNFEISGIELQRSQLVIDQKCLHECRNSLQSEIEGLKFRNVYTGM